jgi:2-C-methyl-D-erythritol 4-phosphate cytidylyltransferase
MRVGAIIPAAGSGVRMGGVRKAFLEIAGRPMLQYSVDVLLAHPAIETIVVALPDDVMAAPPEWLKRDRVTLVAGGRERADSVRAGLHALDGDIDAVLVHDAARPMLTVELIDRVLEPVGELRGATLALQVTDTLHAVEGNTIRTTPDRARFWRAQTPQAFPRTVLGRAYAALPPDARPTDEAGMVTAAGGTVLVVPGEDWNIKVTTPADVTLAEAFLRERAR